MALPLVFPARRRHAQGVAQGAALVAGGFRVFALVGIKMNGHAEQLHQGRGEQGLLGRPLGDDLFVQPDDVIGVMGRQGQVMGHHELSEALLPPGIVEDLPEKAFPLEVHPRRRFVQQQDLGLTRQGRGQQDAAQLTAGKVAHAPPDEVFRMYGRQGRAGTPGGTALDAEPEGAALVPQGKEFGHGQGQGAVHLQVLRHIGQAGSPAAFPLHADLAGIGDLMDDAVQQGAFPRAIGADQDCAAPLGDGGRDVLQDMEVPTADIYMGDIDGRRLISERGHFQVSGSCCASAAQNGSQECFPALKPWNPAG